MFRTIQSVVVAVVAAVALVPSGHAESSMRQNSVKVFYADLDLSTAAGARTMIKRLERATNRVCGMRPAPMHIKAVNRYEACVADSMSRAVAQIDSPVVTAHLASR